MRIRLLLFFLMIALVNGCGRSESLTKEEIQKFITDSENIYTLLETAYQEGRELDLDEQGEFISFTNKYDPESEFRSKIDDPSISLVVSNASLMELMLGNDEEQSNFDYSNYKADFLTELAAVKETFEGM